MEYTVENTVEIGRAIRVFCDGQELVRVIKADTEKGYAICHSLEFEEVRHEGVINVEPAE